jgi:polyhydroxyalkanoate synthesis regulator phasin
MMNVENNTAENKGLERPPLMELLRKVMLAGIGAAALAQEEAEAFIQKLIEKGELAEKDGRVLMKDLREKRRQKTEEELDKRIHGIVERVGIPTRKDIETLGEKIAEITKKVDDLKS